jgi:hypothetical protein
MTFVEYIRCFSRKETPKLPAQNINICTSTHLKLDIIRYQICLVLSEQLAVQNGAFLVSSFETSQISLLAIPVQYFLDYTI